MRCSIRLTFDTEERGTKFEIFDTPARRLTAMQVKCLLSSRKVQSAVIDSAGSLKVKINVCEIIHLAFLLWS